MTVQPCGECIEGGDGYLDLLAPVLRAWREIHSIESGPVSAALTIQVRKWPLLLSVHARQCHSCPFNPAACEHAFRRWQLQHGKSEFPSIASLDSTFARALINAGVSHPDAFRCCLMSARQQSTRHKMSCPWGLLSLAVPTMSICPVKDSGPRCCRLPATLL